MDGTALLLQTTSSIPLVVLGFYLALLVTLGAVGYFRSRAGEEDYYLAGRRQGWIVSSLTIMATFFSSWALLGAAGKVYSEGIIFALFALNVPLSGACVYLFGRGISLVGRENGYVTPGDMVADYYGGEALRVLVAATSLLYVIPYVIMQIMAGGHLFQVLADQLGGDVLPWGSESHYAAGCILLSLITATYVLVGGMRTVAWTDVVQGLMLVTGMLLGGYVVVSSLGGLGGFMSRVSELPDEFLTAPGASDGWPPLFLYSVILFGSTGSMVTPAQWMRYYAASSPRTLRRSAMIFALVLTACFLFGVMLVGIGGQVLFPSPTGEGGAPLLDAETGTVVPHEDVERSDEILVRVLRTQLPALWPVAGPWIVSIIVMAIAAGSMSTADSNLHALSAVLTRDVYDRYIRPRAPEAEKTWVGRAIILAATVVSLLLVLLLEQAAAMIVDVGILAISFSAQLVPLTIDMLWIRRGTRAGAALGLLAGLVVTAVAGWRPEVLPLQGAAYGPFDLRLMPGAWGLAANVIVFALVSLFAHPPLRSTQFRRLLGRGRG